MLKNEADVQKLQDIIRKKFLDLPSEEIDKRANQFLEIGAFWVRFKIKQNSDSRKPLEDKPP